METHVDSGSMYDIIGDVHGYHDELLHLLHKLGYTNETGVWSHAFRKAIFVGDFIDRGPSSRKVIEIIRDMVEAGSAYAILGNHEYNAICYFTKNKSDQPIKVPATSAKKLLDTFKSEYAGFEKELFKDTIKWLRSLPLFLDLDDFRVVHAYWRDANIEFLKENITENRLRKSFLEKSVTLGTAEYIAVQQTLRGLELRLPADLILKDEMNVRRNSFRIKWWKSGHGSTFRDMSYGNKFTLPDYTIPEQILMPVDIYEEHEVPVFFGHYSITEGDLISKHNVCCVDSGIANGGRLAAYHWNGESDLSLDHFVFVKH